MKFSISQYEATHQVSGKFTAVYGHNPFPISCAAQPLKLLSSFRDILSHSTECTQ